MNKSDQAAVTEVREKKQWWNLPLVEMRKNDQENILRKTTQADLWKIMRFVFFRIKSNNDMVKVSWKYLDFNLKEQLQSNLGNLPLLKKSNSLFHPDLCLATSFYALWITCSLLSLTANSAKYDNLCFAIALILNWNLLSFAPSSLFSFFDATSEWTDFIPICLINLLRFSYETISPH